MRSESEKRPAWARQRTGPSFKKLATAAGGAVGGVRCGVVGWYRSGW